MKFAPLPHDTSTTDLEGLIGRYAARARIGLRRIAISAVGAGHMTSGNELVADNQQTGCVSGQQPFAQWIGMDCRPVRGSVAALDLVVIRKLAVSSGRQRVQVGNQPAANLAGP